MLDFTTSNLVWNLILSSGFSLYTVDVIEFICGDVIHQHFFSITWTEHTQKMFEKMIERERGRFIAFEIATDDSS